ncbi:helix-turn-helix domain-containing protein [Flagellimonas eckloniae]|uniref:HTH araC/xylS-type domain-containing protein n=1 Tax=Flagellimonas eckloniae TaxID=346185 RepID=A0A0Q0X1H7_9FLAO|nr:helix-turn-helix domain-containing protein [Allomuricauda eckloniae]KQC31460.1 hypothetical protein AAY42_17445 [Allomuricauda eckloniae]
MGHSKLLVLVCLLFAMFGYGTAFKINERSTSVSPISFQDSLKWADYYYNINRYQKAIDIYEKNLNGQPDLQKTRVLKKLALSKAALNIPEESVNYLEDYLMIDFNAAFIQHEGFDNIRDSPQFNLISQRYLPQLGFWPLVYLYVSIIGFYISIVILVNKNIDLQAKILVSAFVFINSIFILHISISLANYHFEYPHTYLMSILFSYLYGPLLYFYFKRITLSYVFKARDLLHLIPTVLLALYVIPVHILQTSDQKLKILLERASLGVDAPIDSELLILILTKAISLMIYGFFVRKLYLKSKKDQTLNSQSKNWQRNIYYIHFSYIIAYITFGLVIIVYSFTAAAIHVPNVCMAIMVLFVGFSASVRPNLVNGVFAYTHKFFDKYKKSGLTPSLSNELKENLIYLFAVEKIYRKNNINLDMVAQKLNTTRHNASQIINEHFDVSFHEFVNMYRITEAKQLLQEDTSQRLNIINIAYEVGYNNKVTFNKAFKKDTQLTPTEYQKNMIGV